MFLYLIRHALAGEAGDPLWPDDSKRPLTGKGRRRFRRLAEHLVEQGVRPGIIASSPYVRCFETARILAEALDDEPELILVDGLEPGSNLDELLDWSQRQRAGDIAWVGHAPDLGVMAAALLGLSGGPGVRFAKGAVAAINFESGSPARGMGELHWLATAKMLGY